jgi:hypothetical protein
LCPKQTFEKTKRDCNHFHQQNDLCAEQSLYQSESSLLQENADYPFSDVLFVERVLFLPQDIKDNDDASTGERTRLKWKDNGRSSLFKQPENGTNAKE